MLSSYTGPFLIRGSGTGDPAPAKGMLLLDVPWQASASREWDQVDSPAWWNGSFPTRGVVAEKSFPTPWRIRGAREPDKRVVVSRVLP